MDSSSKNDYLEQVKAKQEQLQQDLNVRRAPAQAIAAAAPAARGRIALGARADVDMGQPRPAVDIRITGLWRWRTVIVPPNAYVVHTRRGHKDPVTLGLGVSFRFNPVTDSFLAVPSAMQTILINADCICRELQGLVVQAYVQWIIADFGTAYRKLDFSDAVDPMRLVNLQLREQAEAAIKDKVASMSIDEVLSDKQRIIEELTTRLRAVAEGAGDSDKGLGLRIVTVQIKEAIVSSTRVWESLQKPFRAERARVARLAELAAEGEVKAKELLAQKASDTAQIETEGEIARLRAQHEAESFDRQHAEQARRDKVQQENARLGTARAIETERLEREARRALAEAEIDNARRLAESRAEAAQREALRQAELNVAAAERQAEAARAEAVRDKARLIAEADVAGQRQRDALAAAELEGRARLSLLELERAAQNRQADAEVAQLAARQRAQNEVSPASVQAQLVHALPAIVEKLPVPKELRTVAVGDGGPAQSLTALVAQISALLDLFRRPGGGEGGPSTG
jgi:flotillin